MQQLALVVSVIKTANQEVQARVGRDPEAAVRGVFEWLCVDPDYLPDELAAAHNVTPDEVRQKRSGMQLLDRLRHSGAWSAVGPFVPAALRKMGVAMVEKTVTRRDISLDAVIAHLRPIQQAQTHVLHAQLGRNFDEWKTLWDRPA